VVNLYFFSFYGYICLSGFKPLAALKRILSGPSDQIESGSGSIEQANERDHVISGLLNFLRLRFEQNLRFTLCKLSYYVLYIYTVADVTSDHRPAPIESLAMSKQRLPVMISKFPAT
jgi:hypothetical protein